MNASSLSAGVPSNASPLVVLADDHKLTTVALELVRAAAEYQARRGHGQPTGEFVAEFSRRFAIDPSLSEALLAGEVAVEIDGDRLVAHPGAMLRETGVIARPPGDRCRNRSTPSGSRPEERARRMQSVMHAHATARDAGADAVSSAASVCEILCDLRHWCDEHSIDLYQALDESYVCYMHEKHDGLAPRGQAC
jgi:hypothetical protein